MCPDVQYTRPDRFGQRQKPRTRLAGYAAVLAPAPAQPGLDLPLAGVRIAAPGGMQTLVPASVWSPRAQ